MENNETNSKPESISVEDVKSIVTYMSSDANKMLRQTLAEFIKIGGKAFFSVKKEREIEEVGKLLVPARKFATFAMMNIHSIVLIVPSTAVTGSRPFRFTIDQLYTIIEDETKQFCTINLENFTFFAADHVYFPVLSSLLDQYQELIPLISGDYTEIGWLKDVQEAIAKSSSPDIIKKWVEIKEEMSRVVNAQQYEEAAKLRVSENRIYFEFQDIINAIPRD